MVITTARQPNPTNKAMVTLTNQYSAAIATTFKTKWAKILKKVELCLATFFALLQVVLIYFYTTQLHTSSLV